MNTIIHRYSRCVRAGFRIWALGVTELACDRNLWDRTHEFAFGYLGGESRTIGSRGGIVTNQVIIDTTNLLSCVFINSSQ